MLVEFELPRWMWDDLAVDEVSQWDEEEEDAATMGTINWSACKTPSLNLAETSVFSRYVNWRIVALLKGVTWSPTA